MPRLFGELKKLRKRRRMTLQEMIDKISPVAEQANVARAAATRKRLQDGQRRLTKLHADRRQAKILENRKKGRGVWKVRRLALPGWQVLASRMSEGEWYSIGELGKLVPEFAHGSVKGWVGGVIAGDTFERSLNADYDEGVPGRRQMEPRWLWRLSQEGAGRAEGWRVVLDMVG